MLGHPWLHRGQETTDNAVSQGDTSSLMSAKVIRSLLYRHLRDSDPDVSPRLGGCSSDSTEDGTDQLGRQ